MTFRRPKLTEPKLFSCFKQLSTTNTDVLELDDKRHRYTPRNAVEVALYAALFDEDLDVEEGKRQVQEAVARYQRDHGGQLPPLVRVDARRTQGV